MTQAQKRIMSPFKEFLKLKKNLLKERAGLVERIKQINSVLDAQEFYYPKSESAHLKPRRQINTPRNTMTLRDAVILITRKKPMTKEQILLELDKLGYEFATPKPMNSLNATLYSKRTFKRENGCFSPAEGVYADY